MNAMFDKGFKQQVDDWTKIEGCIKRQDRKRKAPTIFAADKIEKIHNETPEPQGSRGRWDRTRLHEIWRVRDNIHDGTTVQLGVVVQLFKKGENKHR